MVLCTKIHSYFDHETAKLKWCWNATRYNRPTMTRINAHLIVQKKRLIWIPMASAARRKTRERHNSQNIDTEIMLCALKPKRQRKKTKKIAKHFANDIKIIIVHYEFRELTMTVTGFRIDWCKPMPMIHHNSVHSHSHTNSNCGKDGGARARRAET